MNTALPPLMSARQLSKEFGFSVYQIERLVSLGLLPESTRSNPRGKRLWLTAGVLATFKDQARVPV